MNKEREDNVITMVDNDEATIEECKKRIEYHEGMIKAYEHEIVNKEHNCDHTDCKHTMCLQYKYCPECGVKLEGKL